ncbi:MAG: triose-phosphate isomerase [Anaerolineales bacterium]|nr:triose-phosphate isomerase [Anaerolineales bacterium]
MRRPLIAGNWKMNKTPAEAGELAQAMLQAVGGIANVDRVFCPPFVALGAVAPVLSGTQVGLGAQTMHWAEAGAYTGEISAPMLVNLVTYVILGHSERRQYFGETDDTVNKKVKAALKHGLTPIICVGETLAENEAGLAGEVITRQVRAAYAGVPAPVEPETIIAYEPIWAIGTGRAATPEGANHTIAQHIRAVIADLYGAAAAAKIRILYGGSVTGANAAELMAQPDIDGALVGGASLKVADFQAIVQAASASHPG